MWILSCNGDLFQHKKLWLRPGKKHLFGRTSGFAINDKSVSRKHLTIQVAEVAPGDASTLHARTQVTIEDQGSKLGTLLSGTQIRGKSVQLEGERNEIKLGTFEQVLCIKWQPVVFSFSFPAAKNQRNKDPLASVRPLLEPLDIKAVIPYVGGQTTHVVATKRNTSKGLQALINAKYIVTESFVDAVVAAASPSDPADPQSNSPLEEDYDAAWPDPLQHLPPRSNEPTQRPAASFAPDPGRANVFAGYTFIFCERAQFENLQPPITNGGGKALMFAIEYGKTSPEEVVRYVKSIAGEKGTGEFEDGSEGRGVVVVRFLAKEPMEDWSIRLCDEVARMLDHRLIAQNEFLDAILDNDASGLRRPLQEEDDARSRISQAPADNSHPSNPRVTEPEVTAIPATQNPTGATQPPARRGRSRRLVTSRFKGFDDGFDPMSVPQAPKKFEDSPQQASPITLEGTQREEDDGPMGTQLDSGHTAATQQRTGRKRSLPPSDVEDQEAVMDQILPAAAAMKRRRIEEERSGRRREESAAPSVVETQAADTGRQSGRSQKPKKEIDLRGIVKEHREAEDEAARLNEEALKTSIDGMEIEKMRNLAIVESMPVKPRDRAPAADTGTDNASHARWNDAWNGRKNFKRFRRRGAENPQPRRVGGVMVGLEEVKRHGFGVGDDEYWLENDTHGRRKEKEREKEKENGDVPGTTRASQAQPFSTARSHVEEEDESDYAMEPAARTRQASLADKTNLVRPAANVRDGKSTGKRMAPPAATASHPASKKARTVFVHNSDSDDSDDELKFRFKRKR